MGRSEPCVLFSQTFVHPQLDEYVDEVIFAEPVIITACEFLEQNASSTSQAVSLLGATSPPSFALEVFVQCEGETKFKRLCHPFLYSPSAPYPLEVEAVVTNHLVVRGSYRSLSLVIYGNIAKDLGQYNIMLEGRSVTDLVSSAEGNLEDLPLVLHSINRTIEDCISSLNVLYLPVPASDISIQTKQLLQLTFKILELSGVGDILHKVIDIVLSVASCYATHDFGRNAVYQKCLSFCSRESSHVITEARKELLELYEAYQHQSGNLSETCEDCISLDPEVDIVTSKQLVDMMAICFHFKTNFPAFGHPHVSEGTNAIVGLGVALLLCSARESCFHFVDSGGMDQLVHLFGHEVQKSPTITLLLLGVIEQATQHSVGCEGFLGWWPREDENIPSGMSEGYCKLLKLIMQKPCHDVASLASYILHRLRFYEVAARYECAVLSVLESGLSHVGTHASTSLNKLIEATSQLKKLLKLINSWDTIEDPSPGACSSRSLVIGETEGLLSYKATNGLIASSNCSFSNTDIDPHLLVLLKEKGFLPLSAALLSTSRLRSEVGDIMTAFRDTASSVGAIILSLQFSRSGLSFLLHHPQLTATVIHALRGFDDVSKEECVPLRYASALTSKGFTCTSREVGIILEMHLRVVNAIDRLLKATPQTEDFLWILWELCGLSRSDCGRQALLALGFFPEAISVLIEALHSVKDIDPAIENSGASPLNLAIFHSAAEIFEVIVTDSTASSLNSWIGQAIELHKALNSSSPGSNRKDAPARLLKWIDPGVVYHKNGAIGLIRYAALLASGGDAHLSSASILLPDSTSADNPVGEPSTASDINVLENLGKITSEKSFDGVSLPDSSIAQLTTSFRILAFIAENPTVAASLYDEGAITVVYAVLVNCSFMLERSSNIYDYLVDDDHECSSISDFLLERNREQSIVDLLVPSLALLVSLLQKLQEVKEQHRNTKLMNALLRLHREVSPKLAACAADMSSLYPDSALGFGAVCHLIVSALACWPVYGWAPGLFHSLLASIQTTSLLALGPKETCSLLCLMNDLFPEESVWLWRKGMPLLSALRSLSVRTLLGPKKEKQVYWYLGPEHLEKLFSQLTPQLDKLSQIVQHYSISALAVIQDMLRVFIIRIAYQNVEHASVLLRPIILWIQDHVSDVPSMLDMDAYKVYRYLDFIASLLEHPCSKVLLLRLGIVQILMEGLERCSDGIELNENQISETNSARSDYRFLTWSFPIFKSISLLCNTKESLKYCQEHELQKVGSLSTKDCLFVFPFLLNFCQMVPVGKELLSCLATFRELVSCSEGQSALVSLVLHVHSNVDELQSERAYDRNVPDRLSELEWKKFPPLLCCWKKLLKAISLKDDLSTYAIGAIYLLSSASLSFCLDGKSLNLNRVSTLRCLFGIPSEISGTNTHPEENIEYIQEVTTLLSSKIVDDCSATPSVNITSYQASEVAKPLLLLLQKPIGTVKVDDLVSNEGAYPKILPMECGGAEKDDDYVYLGEFGDKFSWECPETLPDRMSRTTIPAKRKLPTVEGANRRARGENSSTDISAPNTISRGLGSSVTPSGSTRRDTFRQRKPNTSRPPSMHVDDYVARERSVDGVANSSAITLPRVGSTSGRPPSIHVDEFMARQRERQHSAPAVVGEAVQVKNGTPVNDRDTDKVMKSKLLKTDLDDDLQGIDIVFDGEESESDDKLPFPQPDDNLQQLVPVMADQSSPHSIVEETESDANESSQFSHMGTPVTSNVDENTQSEFSSRMSVSRPDITLTRERSVSSDKKTFEQSDDLKKFMPVKLESCASTVNSTGFPAPVYSSSQASQVGFSADSRATPKNFYLKNSPQHSGNVHVASGSRGIYDQKGLPNQPPLPPMPPPSSVSPVISRTPESNPKQSSGFVNPGIDNQAPNHTSFQVHPDYSSPFSSSPLLSSSIPAPESKFPRASTSSPAGPIRPPPPLPSTPPPFSSNPYNLVPLRTSMSQTSVYNQASAGTSDLSHSAFAPAVDSQLGGLSASGTGMASYPPPPLMPSLGYNRPSVPMTFYGSTQSQQQSENPPNILQNLSIPPSSIQSIHSQSVPPLQPIYLPQLQRPLQPPQHLRPPIQASQQLDQVVSFPSPVQMQMHSLQMLQPPQVSPLQSYYQPQHQDFTQAPQQLQTGNTNVQAINPQRGGPSHPQQQQDPAMSLQEYFKSPEAIQSLLSDRDKLCQLLEQHPKLMQMLQEKLGHL